MNEGLQKKDLSVKDVSIKLHLNMIPNSLIDIIEEHKRCNEISDIDLFNFFLILTNEEIGRWFDKKDLDTCRGDTCLFLKKIKNGSIEIASVLYIWYY